MKISRPIWQTYLFKVLTAIVTLICVASIAISLVILRNQKRFFLEIFLQEHQSQIRHVARNLLEPLLYKDIYTIYATLRELVENDPHIVWMELRDREGHTLLRYPRRSKTLSEKIIVLSAEITNDHRENLGTLLVGFDQGPFSLQLQQAQLKLLLWTALVILLSVSVILLLSFKFGKPLLALTEAARQISQGRLGLRIDLQGPGEIGELIEAFNRMSTELKSSMERLKKVHEQMAKSEKFYALGQFASGVAHEIRNPLTSISLALELLKSGQGDRKALKVIEREIQRIDRLVQTFLDFARSHSLKLNREKVNLNTLVLELLDLVSFQARKSGIQIRTDLKEVPLLETSSEALRQILLNVMLNAIQAMPRGGELRVRTALQNEHLVVWIEDTGEGIPSGLLERIFEPFFTTKPDGTGIGLAITKNLVELLGGEIHIFSEEGKGTRVELRFPFRAPIHES